MLSTSPEAVINFLAITSYRCCLFLRPLRWPPAPPDAVRSTSWNKRGRRKRDRLTRSSSSRPSVAPQTAQEADLYETARGWMGVGGGACDRSNCSSTSLPASPPGPVARSRLLAAVPPPIPEPSVPARSGHKISNSMHRRSSTPSSGRESIHSLMPFSSSSLAP